MRFSRQAPEKIIIWKSEPIREETYEALIAAVDRVYPGKWRRALDVCPVAVNKTIDCEADALETIRRIRSAPSLKDMPPPPVARGGAVKFNPDSVLGAAIIAAGVRAEDVEAVSFHYRTMRSAGRWFNGVDLEPWNQREFATGEVDVTLRGRGGREYTFEVVDDGKPWATLVKDLTPGLDRLGD